MNKKSQERTGLLSGYQESQKKINERSIKPNQDSSKLYGVFEDQKDSNSMPNYPKHTLSTRYVPGMPGVQAGRVAGQEGGFYNPITKKEYSFSEGFSMDGVDYPPYSVSMQTNLYSLAKTLKEIGFEKYADKIIKLIK